MQFKVPQNVQREDTIIGPITMKQLIICGIGGGLAYAIYVSLAKLYFWEVWLWPVGIVAGITLATAFLKIYDIPFYKFIFLITEYLISPKKRQWVKGSGDTFVSLLTPVTQQQKKSQTKRTDIEIDKKKKIEELSKILQSHGKITNQV